MPPPQAGLTGLWQVTCRGEGLAHEHVEVDLECTYDLSLLTDLRILALTIPVGAVRERW